MKYKITEGVNRASGGPIFYVYQTQDTDEPLLWNLLHGASTIEECRAYLERHRNPVPEKVVEEFEG